VLKLRFVLMYQVTFSNPRQRAFQRQLLSSTVTSPSSSSSPELAAASFTTSSSIPQSANVSLTDEPSEGSVNGVHFKKHDSGYLVLTVFTKNFILCGTVET
jgi:hypothetical protein